MFQYFELIVTVIRQAGSDGLSVPAFTGAQLRKRAERRCQPIEPIIAWWAQRLAIRSKNLMFAPVGEL
jgi:hypothetical protein